MEECCESNDNGDNDDDSNNGSSDFGEGLKRMLSSLYGHTSSNVLSATMAKNYHKAIDFNIHMNLQVCLWFILYS